MVAVLLAVLGGRTASAHCPSDGMPSRDVCKDVNAFFMPGLTSSVYFPKDSGTLGNWYGGGFQVVPMLWSHNTDRFGPGQGKLLFDINLLSSTKSGEGTMLLYRFGGQLSLEKNASRSFAIPFFGVMFGGMNETNIKNVGFFEASIGVHAIYLRNVVVTLEGSYLFPFSNVDQLHGFRAMLAVNFTLW
jgi:hypothetical protein